MSTAELRVAVYEKAQREGIVFPSIPAERAQVVQKLILKVLYERYQAEVALDEADGSVDTGVR